MREHYLKAADRLLPVLIEQAVFPDMEARPLNTGDSVILDLKNHYVGYFSFHMTHTDVYIDAPVKLCVKFCETAQELNDDFSAYRGGLCASWLQEEIIHLDFPGEHRMPRRYAARYIKITVLHTPRELVLSKPCFCAVSSADISTIPPIEIPDQELARIDRVAVNTLKNCMQRVFEDGPKRDRRLWTGDLRLEALANYYTFQQVDIVKRCLYLFAAADVDALGFKSAFVYENPCFVSGETHLIDYALLFVAALCDYYQYSKDRAFFLELYEVAESQLEAANRILDSDGIITPQEGWYAFIDWCDGLEKITALHGVYLYVLAEWTRVLEELLPQKSSVFAERLRQGREAAKKQLYHAGEKRFVNPRDREQYSVHSTVWMILGGVLEGEEAAAVLRQALEAKDSVKPFTPYMRHYVVEAMFQLGMREEAYGCIKEIWGGMLQLNPDAFCEVYVPDQPDFSPYGSRMINSMCHAWSCTPSYFIRKYGG